MLLVRMPGLIRVSACTAGQVGNLVGGNVLFNPAVAFALHMNARANITDENILEAVETYASSFYIATILGGILSLLFICLLSLFCFLLLLLLLLCFFSFFLLSLLLFLLLYVRIIHRVLLLHP